MFSFKLAQKINQTPQAEYDYIVVGAGACGCVIAAKILEQCPGATVAIVEAGGYHEANYGAYIQNMAGYGTQNDYQDQIVDRLFGEDHPGVYHRGLGLGGSTITNGAVWVDTRADIRKWAQLRDLSSWTENLDKHYLELCRLLTPSSQIARTSEIGQALYAALRDGFFNPDGEGHGIRYAESVMDNGQRRDVFSTFLNKYLDDPRFTISYKSVVKKIHLTQYGLSQRAHSLSFEKDGITQTIHAKRKIILTAGAVATPAILQQSGIGPEGSLLRLPVGDHLKVHHMVMLAAPLVKPIQGHHATNMDVSAFCSGLEDYIKPHLLPTRFKVQTFIQRDKDLKPINIVLGCFPFQYHSEGTVRQNPDDTQHPIIRTSTIVDPRDRASLKQALLLADAMLRKLDQHQIVRYTPAFTEENCEAFVAKSYMVDPHFIATCRIGDVVGENFHVHGCTNLMVADASVMPEQTSGNCISAAMMIAQIASDVVKKDWQLQITQVIDDNDTVAVPRRMIS